MESNQFLRATSAGAVALRRITLGLAAALLSIVNASAQETPSDTRPYGLDPYTPRDAALLRQYGATLVAQTPLTELRKLDPYKPSEAALLRDIGGALPLWGVIWYPGPAPASLTPFPAEAARTLPAKPTAPSAAAGEERAAPPTTISAAPTSMATVRRPETNDGVWIEFAGRKWIATGPPVPFERSRFVRTGEYGQFPVYKRPATNEEVIYLPIPGDLLAPYRIKR
jgi:hypothetical protein